MQRDCEGENLFVISGGSAIDSKITEYKHISIVVFIEAHFSEKATIILNIVHNTFITLKLLILTNNATGEEFFLLLALTLSWLLPLGKIFRPQLPFSTTQPELFDEV